MLTQKEQRKIAELALIRSIPTKEFDDGKMENGRLKGLFLKLQKLADKELGKLLQWPDQDDIAAIGIKLDEFGRITGWNGKERHVTSMISFCLGMIEESENRINPAIIDTLNKIIDYFERTGKQRQLCYLSGQVAAEKWAGLF